MIFPEVHNINFKEGFYQLKKNYDGSTPLALYREIKDGNEDVSVKRLVTLEKEEYLLRVDADGISISSSDSPWLLTYLAGKTPENEEELADAIVKLAREKCDGLDDMSCAVIRITEAEKNAQV